jgi:hypothetical protein
MIGQTRGWNKLRQLPIVARTCVWLHSLVLGVLLPPQLEGI